jgi:G3E family GTPase
LAEADVILLNKVDLLSIEERSSVLTYLNRAYPGVIVSPVAALNGALA